MFERKIVKFFSCSESSNISDSPCQFHDVTNGSLDWHTIDLTIYRLTLLLKSLNKIYSKSHKKIDTKNS